MLQQKGAAPLPHWLFCSVVGGGFGLVGLVGLVGVVGLESGSAAGAANAVQAKRAVMAKTFVNCML